MWHRPGRPRRHLSAVPQHVREGTGLGLPIVHRIVTDYGGAIQVSSTVGAGTSIHVRLPHREGTAAAVPAVGAPAAVPREFTRRVAS
jgi:signal transduction histidine kinase